MQIDRGRVVMWYRSCYRKERCILGNHKSWRPFCCFTSQVVLEAIMCKFRISSDSGVWTVPISMVHKTCGSTRLFLGNRFVHKSLCCRGCIYSRCRNGCKQILSHDKICVWQIGGTLFIHYRSAFSKFPYRSGSGLAVWTDIIYPNSRNNWVYP